MKKSGRSAITRMDYSKLREMTCMYSIFRDLAIIILSAKFFGLVARKCKAPQVVGEILAGLLIGPCLLNLVQINDTIFVFAEIGVVLLMFSTGLGTNLKELMRAGPIATLIACIGVLVPLMGGTLLYSAFYGFSAIGSPEFFRALFIGTIMTATSVSITVATLQELGHLKSFLGTTIVSAAVIDDVIGIVVLTCVLGASSGTGTGLGKVLFNTSIGPGFDSAALEQWLALPGTHFFCDTRAAAGPVGEDFFARENVHCANVSAGRTKQAFVLLSQKVLANIRTALGE